MIQRPPFGEPGTHPIGSDRFLKLHDWAAEIEERVPGLNTTLSQAVYQQVAWVGQVIASDIGPAAHLICNQAVNDLIDLIGAAHQGAGRSAMRAARSLVEHAINLHTVLASEDDAQRYVDHLEQAPALLLDMAPGVELLTGTARRSYEYGLGKTGRPARRNFTEAVARYGSAFGRGWTPVNLHDRATRHGLADQYTFYKFASLVAHGSAGGTVGTRRPLNADVVTHRTGPALALAPIALWGGVRGYRSLLSAVEARKPDLPASEWGDALLAIDRVWPDYYAALSDLDAELWPDTPTQPPTAVFAYTQTGKERWYLHLPQAGVLIEADRPSLNDAQAEACRRLVADAPNHPAFTPNQRWVTATFWETAITPKPDGRVLPDTALLTTHPDGWELRPYEESE